MSTYVIAETTSGRVRGSLKEGIHIFKGIPYGADTGGARRFMPPAPRAAWTGVRDALEYGPSAPQTDPNAPREPVVHTLIGQLNDQPESEDCLMLNVWTGGLRDGRPRPVMVWCHGGGFHAGSGSSQGYDGSRMVDRGDVVVVTINHRLNVLGFLHLGKVLPELGADASNVGLLDIVHALRWVRENIAAFGGDPEQVTIFGESGGGRKVGCLLAMPSARGLFKRAIIQSGPTLKVTTPEVAEQATDAVLAELKLHPSDLSLRALQALPLGDWMSAYFAASRRHGFTHILNGYAPVVDGHVLPQHPFHAQASDLMPDVPLIVGTNRTEMTLMLASDRTAFELDEAGMEMRVRELLGDRSQSVITAYRRSLPAASPSELFFLVLSDYRYCAALMKLAERRAALGAAPVYFYYFCWETPIMGGKLHSPHALEISFVFDNTERSRGFTGGGPRPAALADKISDAWIAFARTGCPDTSKLPVWPPYDAEQRATMVFNDESRIELDPNRERRAAMQAAMRLG
jgi:para-nitrobenzyl esterase